MLTIREADWRLYLLFVESDAFHHKIVSSLFSLPPSLKSIILEEKKLDKIIFDIRAQDWKNPLEEEQKKFAFCEGIEPKSLVTEEEWKKILSWEVDEE